MERLLTNLPGVAQAALQSAFRHQTRLRMIGRRPAHQAILLITMLGLCWEECGENPVIFCYRIWWTLAALFHERRAEGTA
jgi:hypothetical protein